MRDLLVISALGRDRTGLVNELSQAILDAGGNIEDSRMAVLGGEFAVIMLVAGDRATIKALTDGAAALEEQLGLTLVMRPTAPRQGGQGLVPYQVSVVAMDHPGIVHEVADFFSSRAINIEELATATYPAAHTGTPMFSLRMVVALPAAVAIGELRHQFQEFCDGLNLDTSLEPAHAEP